MKLVCFVFLLSVFSAFGEEIPHPELRNLYEADLIVDANFKSQSETHFYIVVNEIIMDRGYGIKKGDQIKLRREDNGCGDIVDFSYFKRGRYYLKKYPKKWILNYSSTQSIKPYNQFGQIKTTDLNEGQSLNKCITQFINTYKWDTSIHDIVLVISNKELKKAAKVNPIIKKYESINRIGIGGYDNLVYMEEMANKEAAEERKIAETPFCDATHIKAEPSLDENALREFLIENEIHLSGHSIEGKLLIEFLVNEEGEVSVLKVLRGLHPDLDKIAIDKLEAMEPWNPAKDKKGKAISCKLRLPFNFKISHE